MDSWKSMKENIHDMKAKKPNNLINIKKVRWKIVLMTLCSFILLTTPVLLSWTILIPVAMDMGGTESEAVVQQCWVNHVTCVCSLQQVLKVAQVPVTSSHAISSTVLIQNKHLTWAKPTLQAERSTKEAEGLEILQKGITCRAQ